MKIRCVWEHHGQDSLLYSENYAGAFTRGKSRAEALDKMAGEIASYLEWKGYPGEKEMEAEIVQEKDSDLNIGDADSDVLFDSEKGVCSREEYEALKALALKSAGDFLALYTAVPDKGKSVLRPRQTFYGRIPRTALEMYEHTKNVNEYYFSEIGVAADNEGTILECRERGFALLEQQPDFLENKVFQGSYGEEWSLKKLLRRFIWHDRIHARAMYRMAVKTFGPDAVPDIFRFCTAGK